MTDRPTIVTVPCFSGAPWSLVQLTPLEGYPRRTMRLPEGLDDIEQYADFVAGEAHGLDHYVLVGDSFGAVVALGLATRRPPGLQGLVLSGGFAVDPVTNPLIKALIRMARFFPGPLYRQITLRVHARLLSSPHDLDGEVPWTRRDSHRLFVENTPHRSYVGRARAAFSADFRARLPRIDVPTLILSPSYDRLIGPTAAQVMQDGIPRSTHRVLPETGHLFRFTHPVTYGRAVRGFLSRELGLEPAPRRATADLGGEDWATTVRQVQGVSGA